jgi:hypothetical protein
MPDSLISNSKHNIKVNSAYLFGIAVIILVSILLYTNMVSRYAIDAEALVNFKFMRDLSLFDVWTGETVPGHFVTYRPVTASIIRIEYLLFGINPPAFFTVNIILLSVVAFLIFEIVFRKTRELLPALFVALFFLTDWRLVTNVKVIGEIQITLAALFGLSALWLVWFGKIKFKPVFVFFCLLMSALSKEFGLAFAFAVFINALINRKLDWKKYLGLSVGVVITYIAIRVIVDTIPTSTREYSSFLNILKWYVVNISSGFFYSFLNIYHPASDGDVPNYDNLRYSSNEAWQIIIFQIIPIVTFFILGFSKKADRKLSIPLLALIIGNSILFFFKYAFRFHFLGNIGIYIIAGFGLNLVFKKMLGKPKQLNLFIFFNILIAIVLLWRGIGFKQDLDIVISGTDRSICTLENELSKEEIKNCLAFRSLCIPTDEYYQQKDYHGYYSSTDPETVRLVMEFYDLPQEYCTCLDPDPMCDQ